MSTIKKLAITVVTVINVLFLAFVTASTLGLIGAPVASAQSTYDDLVHWVDWMAKKYDMGTIYVAQESMPEGTYGETRGRTITFNSYYINNPQQLQSDLSNDVANEYHPGEQCTATQILAAHESAHVLDYITGWTADYELEFALENGFSGEVSGYSINEDGTPNYPEALADAMVAVECDTPTPAEKAIYTMLVT